MRLEMERPKDAIELIYSCILDDDAFSAMLCAVAAEFGCHSAVLFYRDQHRPSADVQVAFGPFEDPEVQARYLRDFASLDPAPAAMARISLGEVASTDALFAATVDLYRPFLDGFYHPLGLAGALGGPVVDRQGRIGLIAVHRGPGRPPFDEADCAAMKRLMPHVMRMLELRHTFFDMGSRLDLAGRALDPIAQAVMTFGKDGRLVHANRSARQVLARGDGLGLDRSGRLTAADRAGDALLAEAFGRSAAPTPSILRIPRSDGAAPYLVRVWRQDGSGAPGGAATTVLYISDPARRDPASPADLSQTLGLTASGAKLLAALMAGRSLADYAKEAPLSLNTVKSHLRMVFEATGTRRQADLLRLAVSVANDLGL